MKRMLFALTAIAIGLVASIDVAQAGTCESVCTAAKKTCQLAASTTLRACRFGARRSAGSHRDAVRNCRDTFRTERDACVGALHECAQACSAPPAPGSCDGDCADAGRACLQGVVADGKSCVQGCTGGGRLACMVDCLGDARSGLADCKTTLTSCRAECSAPPPDDSCAGGCRADGRLCGQQAVSDLKDCVDSCESPGKLRCTADCASTARSDLDSCKDDLDSCLAGCEASPSGAFIFTY